MSKLSSFAPLALLFAPVLLAQTYPGPMPAPLPPPIAQPVDTPYPGIIHLAVDVTDLNRRIIQVHETIPVTAGELTLEYPKWLPGDHKPDGTISKMAGLVLTANGKPLPWVRDRVDVFAFHVTIPTGVKSITADFQYLDPVRAPEGRFSMSADIVDFEWNTALLYPAGHFARQITFEATVKIPEGWHYATALDTLDEKKGVLHFKPTTLNTLMDSPLYAGDHYQRIDLSTSADNKVYLNLFGDTDKAIALTPEQIQMEKNLTLEAQKAYGSHHYDHYDFLYLISDKVGGVGLEHHQSSEDGSKASFFTDWLGSVAQRDLLAHEYTHSWNGKFRRPAGLWTPEFNVTPMQDDLLWVYEGMTQYYGNVLTARAGQRSLEEAHDLLAQLAAGFDVNPGRTWRPLIDTTNQPVISQRMPVSWVSWQRPEDYYTEGMLIWLDADTKIRELSKGAKSLDDFCKIFLGIDNGSFVTRTYTLDDVVHDLNAVQPYDWAGFLKARVYDLAPLTPKDGFERGGYKIVYTDTISPWRKHAEETAPTVIYSTSVGFTAANDGTLGDVWWNSIAYKAGLVPGIQLVAVNDTAFKQSVLHDAIVAAETSKSPIKLLLKRDDHLQTIELDYHGGLRYPHLERIPNTENRIDSILSPGGR